MAPFLFNFYINDLDKALSSLEVDFPYVGRCGFPVLLYAVDAVLLARTPVGLQSLLEAFSSFMSDQDLSINHTKSFVMQVGRSSKKVFQFRVGSSLIPQTNAFSYLGVLLDDQLQWGPQIRKNRGAMDRANTAFFNFATKIRRKPIGAMLKVYQAKSLAIASYGSEIWGYNKATSLQVAENKFFKRLLSAPQSLSNMVAHEELGVQFLCDTLALRPIVFWLKCWLNPELTVTHIIIQECITLDKASRIPWLSYIKCSLEEIGRLELYYKPNKITRNDVELVKASYLGLRKGNRDEQELKKDSVRRHIMLKTIPLAEPYLLGSLSTHEKFLLTRFRTHTLHLLLARPKGFHIGQELVPCGCDGLSPQDLLHFMFFCKFYSVPRKHFLVPVLKRMSFRQVRPALLYLQLLKEDCIFFVVGYLKSIIKSRLCIDI